MAGCLTAGPHTVPGQPDAVPMTAIPTAYWRWWADLQRCSGATGDIGAIGWFVVTGGFVVVNDQLLDGYWSRSRNQIVLPEWRMLDSNVVRHEMLHALLQDEDHVGAFTNECRGLVGDRPRP